MVALNLRADQPFNDPLTHAQVDENFSKLAASAVPEGGTTGQVLAKASDDDNDTEWVDQSGGGASWTTLYNDAPDGVNYVEFDATSYSRVRVLAFELKSTAVYGTEFLALQYSVDGGSSWKYAVNHEPGTVSADQLSGEFEIFFDDANTTRFFGGGGPKGNGLARAYTGKVVGGYTMHRTFRVQLAYTSTFTGNGNLKIEGMA